MFDPNVYLNRAYETPPCWQLVTEVCAHELGIVVANYRATDSSIRAIAEAFRLALHADAHGFKRIDAPHDLCVVLMSENTRLGLHHCGIYWQGSVLHALSGAGVLYQDMASLRDRYRVMEFWSRAGVGVAS